MVNIPITNDELLEADTNDFDVLIVNFTSNCSIRSRSPNEILVQVLDEDSKLSGPVDGTHGSGYMNCIGAGLVCHRKLRIILCWQQIY